MATATASTVTPSQPQQLFDLSVLQGLSGNQKYLGKNTVSDIQSTYQTYLTGVATGKGGQYATDSAKKYGVSIVEAARGYLVGAGIPLLSAPTPATTTTQDITDTTQDTTDTTKKPDDKVQENPFKILAEAFASSFGNAVYNPPLQTQSTGYTPISQETPSGSNIGLFIILGVVGVIAYFLYKKFAS